MAHLTADEVPIVAGGAPAGSGQAGLWRRRIFIASWLSYAAFYFCRKNLSVLMPLLSREQGYSNGQFANLIFAFSLAYVLGQFLSGSLADRYGAQKVVTAGALLSVTATVLMGLWQNPTAFLVLEFVNGLGQATGWTGSGKLMAAWFERRERGVVMAWWGTSYVLGGFLASVFATWIVTNPNFFPELGWRRGMFGPALILLLVTAYFFWKVRDDPKQAGIAARIEDDGQTAAPASATRTSWAFLRNGNIQAIACMYFLVKLMRYSLLFWLPLYLSQRLHYSDGRAGYTSSLFELVGFLGPVIAGYISDRMLESRRFPVGATMLWALALVCLLNPFANMAGFWGTAILISVTGILIYGPDMLMSLPAVQDAAGRGETARALGYVNGVGSCGQLVSAYAVAGLVRWFGWDSTFALFAALSVLAGVILAWRWNADRPGIAGPMETAEPAAI